ncbi:MAG: tetratricopeptide repeat protein [Candidatus Acidiferrales bacterium]
MRFRTPAAIVTVLAFILVLALLPPAWAQDSELASLRAQADAGDGKAQFTLGNRYYGGRGVVQDYGQALVWYRQAADRGLALAQTKLGSLYEHGPGVSQDYGRALTFYRMAADHSDALAQYRLATLYEYGRGVQQDYWQAMVWLRKAADQGDPDAEEEIGCFYQRGFAAPRDYGQALTWYQKAADQGQAEAENQLGYMAQAGMGVPQDYVQALTWYYKAAEQGNSDAQENLGYMYQHGLGVAPDCVQAQTWYYKSAGRGNTNAENQLGWIYQFGLGVAPDYAQALAWYRIAADQGNTTAIGNLKALSEKMQNGDPAQWASANAFADQHATAQADRRSQIVSLVTQLAELALAARQDDRLAAQMEQPSNAGASAIVNTVGTLGAANFRTEAEGNRAEAARLREKLTQLDARPAASVALQQPAAPPPPATTNQPSSIIDAAIGQVAAIQAIIDDKHQEAQPAAQQANAALASTAYAPSAHSDPQSGPQKACTNRWMMGTFKVTASLNDQLQQYADTSAVIVDQAGNPASRGGFLSLAKGAAPDLPVYYGFNGDATERLAPGQTVRIPVQTPSDPNQATTVPLTVKYCESN